MFGTVGLRTHIWNNALKSLALLAGFPLLLFLILYAFSIVMLAFEGQDVASALELGVYRAPSLLPVAVAAAAIWFTIAYFSNVWIISAATGARSVARQDEPRLYNLLENLCISRGMPMPRLRIMETEALNAYAAGLTRSQHMIAVTRGLMDTLSDEELEAVLAHELTHIRNSDVRLLVIATAFAGIISLAGDLLSRSWRIFEPSPGDGRWGGPTWGGGTHSSGNSSGKKGSGGAGAIIILLLIAVALIFLARLLAIVIRFTISRSREFMADGGAVELTKNPDAMISALRKIEGRSHVVDVPADVRPMFFDDHAKTGFMASLFATHPSIEDRVQALVQTAGGRDPGPYIPPAGPWGSLKPQLAARRQ
ncbi:protease HtpX [Agaricicola taiwanensis]|uniref:Protease HtpX n=2 Tax=Agaricicola taiwanensis TaxID=591372 RepID=A0A8J2YJA4_9RHOB|nr:protease HtpX [Agaricicola taiwanensis]